MYDPFLPKASFDEPYPLQPKFSEGPMFSREEATGAMALRKGSFDFMGIGTKPI